VWTGTVRARGPRATEALEGLAARTDWRLFVPKQGVFLAPADEQPVLNR
jgi:hypothetical protein